MPASKGCEWQPWLGAAAASGPVLPEILGPAWPLQSPRPAGNLPFLSSAPSPCQAPWVRAGHSPQFSHKALLGWVPSKQRSGPIRPARVFLLLSCLGQGKVVDSLGFRSLLWPFLIEARRKAVSYFLFTEPDFLRETATLHDSCSQRAEEGLPYEPASLGVQRPIQARPGDFADCAASSTLWQIGRASCRERVSSPV